MDFSTLINYVKENDASDVLISPEHPPVVRISGELHMLRVSPLDSKTVDDMIFALLTPEQKARFLQDRDIDFSLKVENQRFRANVFITEKGTTMALRPITNKIKTLKELMVPPLVEKFTHLKKGLVIVTGPTGSGKSTTLAAMINHINQEQSKHILTIEDPIEYNFTSNKCMINQREVGTHTASFASALKSALRENPDIIMIGELRDLETIQLALTAAETGHLVFCTLHTSSAAKTIDRIIDVFPAGDKAMIRTMLATSLEGIVSQMLLPTQNNKSRVSAYEVLLANSAIRNLIRESKLHQVPSMMQIGIKQGMVLMEHSIKRLFEQSYIDEEVAKEYLKQLQDKEEKKTEEGEAPKSAAVYQDNEF